LPVVSPGTVEDDLARRDFSVNAMALPLHSAAGDELLDPFGGRADLRARTLVALHEASFIDDPTRLFRALRYASRFDLRIAAPTARWLRAAVDGGALDTVSGDRITHEIERMLEERDPGSAARRTARWGLLGATARGWSLGSGTAGILDRLARCRTRPPWPEAADPEVHRAAGLRALLLGSRPGARAEILSRLAIRGRPAREILDDLERFAGLRRSLARARRPGGVVTRLENAGEPALLLLHCAGGEGVAATVRRYARQYRRVRAPLDGHAARRLGASGPQIGALLRAARLRALEGRKADERWARAWLARRGP
jgi:tRNA nucleotidyltransferase (CCA-adding enzyme)